jgi:radical SAM superfamily enzyme YgiQ (UPF0313 family)
MAKSMRKPNVLFVIPHYFSTKVSGYVMPMGILYVSASLKESGLANVFTLNLNHQNGNEEDVLEDYLFRNKIDIVGTTGISGQFNEVFPLVKTIRRIDPNITIFVGGGMITADAIPAMEAFESYVDYGCIGEGEITIREFVKTFSEGGNMAAVCGLIYQEKGNWVITPRREDIKDLDSIPLPDYEGFDYNKYLEMNVDVENGMRYSQVAIIGGRSCKYNCTFCFHPSGSHYRQRSLDSIFSEIDYLMAHYNVNYIALREELFASDEHRVLDFCHRIKSYSLVWSIQLRVDSVTPYMVNALKQSNCRYVFLGIESADNRILKSMRKNITIEQVERALDLTIEAGLDTRSTIILGDEAETVESARRTIEWWKEHHKLSSIVMDMIIAFPGSTLYKNARRNGRIPDPVRFLQDGCPILNLSPYLTDEEYKELVQEVSSYNCIPYQVFNYR